MKKPQHHRWTGKSDAFDLGAMASFAILMYLWLFPLAAFAQATPRDYSISPPPVRYSPDGRTAVVSFTVSNQGGDAAEPSLIVITENQSGSVAISEFLPALAAGQTQSFSVELPLADYADDDIFFKIEAGIDDYEVAGSPIARNNTQLFRINKTDARAATGLDPPSDSRAPFDIFIPIVNLGIDFRADGIQLNDSLFSRDDILGAVASLALALFCLWLLSLILRLIFRRPPRFDVWQPPYAVNNWHDPNSAPGRRQSWQFHARNSAIPKPSAPDQVAVVKRLLDKRGVILGSWKVIAMRTVQYDVYGRINRTEALMPRKIINSFNRVLRRAPNYANHELRKAISPIAKSLSKYALAPVEQQNLMLPLALDIRFEGVTEEVRIQFELYQYREGAWRLIDQWEPEFGQVGEHVPEHFTFSLHGQLSGESKGEFKTRLRDDLTQLLAGLFNQRQVEKSAAPAGDSESQQNFAGSGKTLDAETDPRAIPSS
ncbi:MAG: hypothetical protein OXG49_11620 [Chloroflexi bacterium]|nr:hypothetical protein [Chloroflexota bacterium]